ncbi:MAG: hypothetical protein JSV27_07175 [Candidatus Bathyarchaeota archaeon]|nr:MAG: hypothetical protein JSV27_07175 [Candidatus Bathyarchaeota archaeon]
MSWQSSLTRRRLLELIELRKIKDIEEKILILDIERSTMMDSVRDVITDIEDV